jgi:hypothetical protein
VATNFYFNNYPANQITSEQLLVEDLVIEAMKINGMDVYYMPRTTRDQVDYLYGEDTTKEYRVAHYIEMYMENVTGMEGEGDFMSKFGLEIRDEMTLLVSRSRFRYTNTGYERPREGDLIYIPLLQNFFEIMFVEHENNQAMFYTLGRGRGGNVYVYALKMKQFVFSNEYINTGIKEIDDQIRDSYPRVRISLGTGSGTFLQDEIIYQGANVDYATATAYVDRMHPNTSVDIYFVHGQFVSGNVKGQISSSEWVINVYDSPSMNVSFEDIADNDRLEATSDSIIDFTEHNPFGEA